MMLSFLSFLFFLSIVLINADPPCSSYTDCIQCSLQSNCGFCATQQYTIPATNNSSIDSTGYISPIIVHNNIYLYSGICYDSINGVKPNECVTHWYIT